MSARDLDTAKFLLEVAEAGDTTLSVTLRPPQVRALLDALRQRDSALARVAAVRAVISESAPDLGHPQMDADLYARWECERVKRALAALGEVTP